MCYCLLGRINGGKEKWLAYFGVNLGEEKNNRNACCHSFSWYEAGGCVLGFGKQLVAMLLGDLVLLLPW